MATGRETSPDLGLRQPAKGQFSSDGKLFAAPSQMGFAKLWETGTWREVATLRGFLLGAHGASFSPDSTRLAVCGNAMDAVKLWDVESHQHLLTLEGQGSLYRSTAFSPDGNVIGSMNSQGLLHLWRAPSWAEIAAAEAKEKAEIKQQ